ncbi:HemN [Oceaniovalibus guishaninsula JLT2003]|uniref:Heme chaperone HemW n=1 Tax=Oceaniovalibus guishaninsula JLT2003 TaxID=1231392 RepID=K2GPV4_9RHOB|nr:radical SAM family heme chaperone HemW [Oceaniovalibus guishaninsula]EKE44666.1 HemN [Oceaniovalibus guishaninsula JLT2003]
MPDFGVYLHWPFCQAKCPYCDFNSHVAATIDQGGWKRAYLAEIARVSALTPDRIVTSVFFGGGTPSLMDPDLVAAIVDGIRRHWRTANDVEITLEANPTSVEAGRFRAYRDGGVNRVSMGIQALNDADLKRLGRLHSVAEARAAFDIARRTFNRVSFDLIYARQDQTLAAWRTELAEALTMAADHLSLYQLTVEDGTAFGDRLAQGGLRGLPDEDLGADLFALTQDMTDAAGLPAYEVSNHARPGAESRHNLTYWRGGDYAGIGPGAHGRLTLNGTRHATVAPKAPAAWLSAVETGELHDAPQPLSSSEVEEERLMMGLRLSDGIDLPSPGPIRNRVSAMVKLGMMVADGTRMAVTPQGRPLLNAILRELLA